jgi:hypothetical protein
VGRQHGRGVRHLSRSLLRERLVNFRQFIYFEPASGFVFDIAKADGDCGKLV